MIEPVTVTVVLNTTPAAAFAAFVANINDWWPVESFSVCSGIIAVDARDGGAITETAEDGAQHVWGTIAAWQPPHHLEINWTVGEARIATAITLDFVATDDGRTGVTLVHDGWDALGSEGVSKRGNYQMGWDAIFATRYAAFAAATCPPIDKRKGQLDE